MSEPQAQAWEECVAKDLKARIIDDLGDEKHVPNKFEGIEAFLRRYLALIDETKKIRQAIAQFQPANQSM